MESANFRHYKNPCHKCIIMLNFLIKFLSGQQNPYFKILQNFKVFQSARINLLTLTLCQYPQNPQKLKVENEMLNLPQSQNIIPVKVYPLLKYPQAAIGNICIQCLKSLQNYGRSVGFFSGFWKFLVFLGVSCQCLRFYGQVKL